MSLRGYESLRRERGWGETVRNDWPEILFKTFAVSMILGVLFLIVALIDSCCGDEVTRQVIVVDRRYEAPYETRWTEMRNVGSTEHPMHIPITHTTHHPARYLIIVQDEEVERTVDCERYFSSAREGQRMTYHEKVGKMFHLTLGAGLTP